jgi:hypothetical protein
MIFVIFVSNINETRFGQYKNIISFDFVMLS